MWDSGWLFHMHGSIWIVLLQFALQADGGQPCTFYTSGSPIATYCETNCCDNTCCNQSTEDTRTASIVIGVVAAVVLIVIIGVLVMCCCKHRCPCWSHKKDQRHIPLSDNTISVFEDAVSDTDHTKPHQVKWMAREETFSI